MDFTIAYLSSRLSRCICWTSDSEFGRGSYDFEKVCTGADRLDRFSSQGKEGTRIGSTIGPCCFNQTACPTHWTNNKRIAIISCARSSAAASPDSSDWRRQRKSTGVAKRRRRGASRAAARHADWTPTAADPDAARYSLTGAGSGGWLWTRLCGALDVASMTVENGRVMAAT